MSKREDVTEGGDNPPIRLPQDDEEFDASELEARVASLLSRYGCDATEEGWRRLAIQLAVRYKEAGFEIALPPISRRPMEDQHNHWDEMIEAHLLPPKGSGAKQCSTLAEAAAAVARYLRNEWEQSGRVGKKPPEAATLASQYSARNARRSPDALRSLPKFILQYVRMLRVFRALDAASVRLARRAGAKL